MTKRSDLIAELNRKIDIALHGIDDLPSLVKEQMLMKVDVLRQKLHLATS